MHQSSFLKNWVLSTLECVKYIFKKCFYGINWSKWFILLRTTGYTSSKVSIIFFANKHLKFTYMPNGYGHVMTNFKHITEMPFPVLRMQGHTIIDSKDMTLKFIEKKEIKKNYDLILKSWKIKSNSTICSTGHWQYIWWFFRYVTTTIIFKSFRYRQDCSPQKTQAELWRQNWIIKCSIQWTCLIEHNIKHNINYPNTQQNHIYRYQWKRLGNNWWA